MMGMPKYQWTEYENTFFFYLTATGQVVGIAHKIGVSSSIYLAKIILKNEELILGRYVSLEYAKIAIDNYWFKESRTLLESK